MTGLNELILKQHVTEKSTRIQAGNQYVFKVKRDINKLQIKKAVESAFNVKVADVKTVNVLGKKRNFGQIQGKKKDWKKAYVSLLDGYSIDLSNSEKVKD